MQEERAFDMLLGRMRQQWWRLKQRFNSARRQRKDSNHMVIKCPRCGQKLRVPGGKGLIRITCKRCTSKFERKV
jgi:DNA-directed RNA polymerase subunit RPC12/RpoP